MIEELKQLVTQKEGCLIFRPLSALSSHPIDFQLHTQAQPNLLVCIRLVNLRTKFSDKDTKYFKNVRRQHDTFVIESMKSRTVVKVITKFENKDAAELRTAYGHATRPKGKLKKFSVDA